MSFDFRGIRVQSNDPLTQFLVEQQKRLAKFLTENQVAAVDSDNEDIYTDAQDMETAIKWHSELSGQHQFHFQKDYFPPFEPDNNFVKAWLRGRNLGGFRQMKDLSGFNNTASSFGDPTLVDGTLDEGTQTHGIKSIALRLNRTSSAFTNQEYIQMEDHTDLGITTLSTGFSEFIRFRIFDIAQQQSLSRTLYAKIDDSTPNYARMLQVRDDGKLVFVVKRAGTTTAKETAAGTIAVNSSTGTPYDVFVTYSTTGPTMHIYVDGVDKSLSNFGGAVTWQEDLTDHDWFGFRRGASSTGFLDGDFYDYKFYKGMVVSQAEVTHHYTNKWTISDIGFGHVMIVDHYATYTGSGGEETLSDISFSPTSFSPTSFTVV